VEIISSSRDSLAIALKPKRKYIKSHVSEYVEFIKSWSHQGKFKLLDPDIDIFELISSARLVVVIPFSTPALIAKRLGVKSCYYNPDKRYRFKKFVDGVRVIKTVEEIVDFYNSK
jgi:polysaccharide biosynthesis PFTS motif protein